MVKAFFFKHKIKNKKPKNEIRRFKTINFDLNNTC